MSITDKIVNKLRDKEHDLHFLINSYLYCKGDTKPENISSLRAFILFHVYLAKKNTYTRNTSS